MMRQVEIVEIEGKLGNDLRNDLIFELTGGAGNPVGRPTRCSSRWSPIRRLPSSIRLWPAAEPYHPCHRQLARGAGGRGDQASGPAGQVLRQCLHRRERAALRQLACHPRRREPRRPHGGGADPRAARRLLHQPAGAPAAPAAPAASPRAPEPMVAVRAGDADTALARRDPRHAVVLIFGPTWASCASARRGW